MLNKFHKYSVVVKVRFKAAERENDTHAVLQSDHFQHGHAVWAPNSALTTRRRDMQKLSSCSLSQQLA